AGTAAEAAAGRNRFAEMDFDAGANAEFPLQCVRRGIDQILADRLEREGLGFPNGETNTGSPGGAQPQLIVQGNGLKDSAELVIGVRAFAENVQPEIDFSEGWNSDFAHAAIAVWLLAQMISELRDAWFRRVFSLFQRFYRFRRRREPRPALPPGIFPIQRQPVRCDRAWNKRHPGANELWRRGLRARALCE